MTAISVLLIPILACLESTVIYVICLVAAPRIGEASSPDPCRIVAMACQCLEHSLAVAKDVSNRSQSEPVAIRSKVFTEGASRSHSCASSYRSQILEWSDGGQWIENTACHVATPSLTGGAPLLPAQSQLLASPFK